MATMTAASRAKSTTFVPQIAYTWPQCRTALHLYIPLPLPKYEQLATYYPRLVCPVIGDRRCKLIVIGITTIPYMINVDTPTIMHLYLKCKICR